MNKTPLKAWENIRREVGIPYFSTLYDIDMWREDIGIVDTTLKVNEIIKNKRVNVAYFIYLFENLQMEDKKALKEYNYSAGSKWAITMEELVILKEVLL